MVCVSVFEPAWVHISVATMGTFLHFSGLTLLKLTDFFSYYYYFFIYIFFTLRLNLEMLKSVEINLRCLHLLLLHYFMLRFDCFTHVP